MAKSIARDAEDFARLMFRTVERLGPDGDWVPARAAFAQTVADHPEHPYSLYLEAKPSRRIGLAAVAERMRAAEFEKIERRKAGGRRNAPVFYRVARPVASLELHLPADIVADHPLVKKHKAAASAGDAPASMRRTALTVSGPKSPWRRRLLPHPIQIPTGLEAASQSVRQWWERLRVAVSGITAGARRG